MGYADVVRFLKMTSGAPERPVSPPVSRVCPGDGQGVQGQVCRQGAQEVGGVEGRARGGDAGGVRPAGEDAVDGLDHEGAVMA